MALPFMFFDLRTSDVPTARRFYGELFDWPIADVPAGDRTIPMLTDGHDPWAGFTQLAPDDERRPQWVPYVPVDDLDAATARAKELGATVVRERVELAQGSLAVLDDPTGAALVLWQHKEQDRVSPGGDA
ncbi:VOC family protein [Actinophytocola sp.]|jgi:hypothetical protein|uniref:VOC family protein n=1 Tax=Actinophytocola sp. TaxID=1872138 RepID=UPI002ED9A69E